MANHPLKIKTFGRAVVLGLVLAVSFFVFDRLSFLGLRQGADRYYASLRTDALKFSKGTFFGSGDGDLLIFGTSRARHAFAQDILSARLNKRIVKEAGAGKFPEYSYYFYEKYRKAFRLPKSVLYGLDYFMFEKYSGLEELARLDKNIKLAAMNPEGRINASWPLLSRVSLLFRMKPEIDRFLGNLMKFGRDVEADDEDAPAILRKPGRKTRAGVHRVRKTVAVKPDTWQTRTYMAFPGVEGAYLKKLLDDLQEDGVPAFLVILPDYVGANDTNFEQDKFKADIRALASRFRNVHVLDFNRADRLDLDDPKYFSDGAWGKSNCHLSLAGMREFTRRLAADLRRALKEGSIGSSPGKEPGT